MNPLRSVGARLGLALAVVVAAALILVDLIVVPSLERNLIDAKLHQLSEAAPGIGSQLLNSANYNIDETIQSAADSADARVVYFDPITFHPPRLRVYADSNPVTSADIENDTLAQRAFVEARAVKGTTTEHGIRYAEVAYPVFGGPVVLLRASLHDSLRSINLVRRRLVVAGLIALAASLLVGYLRLRSSPGGSGGSSGQPIGSRAVTSVSPSSIQGGTSLPSWPPPSSGCGSAWPSSSTRGGSSSPTRRTSCAHRSSPSAASSS